MPPPLLSNRTLGAFQGRAELPRYARARVTPGIIHLGVGAFHRAHQAVYIDDRLAAGETEWGIVGASLRSAETRDALTPQDGLYTLVLRDSGQERLRVIGALISLLVGPEDPARLLRALTDPRIRIVSLTITEKGYAVDLGTGGLRRDHPDVQHDLRHPHAPRSALGYLAEALDRRRAAGTAPFTLLSCDNLPQNGRTLHRVLQAFAAARDPDLARHIADDVACPSSMVDRIVPSTTDADRAGIAAALGVTDHWPVIGESFSQWVIEDRFPTGRPALEAAGVQFVADVAPFEHMKLRLLNGAHSTMAAIGRLAGFQTVAEAIRVPVIRAFLDVYWREVIPTLAIDPAEAQRYTQQLLDRFGNTALHHRLAQIAGDASQKLPQRIFAALRDRISAGAPHGALVFAVAAWIRSCGVDDHGAPLALNDPTFAAWPDRPDQTTLPPGQVVQAFLRLTSVFGADLPANQHFVADLTRALETIARDGVLQAAHRHLAAQGEAPA